MTTDKIDFFLENEAATEQLAKSLADIILPQCPADSQYQGVSAATLHLSGDLGAGKTAFARAFLRHCGVTGRIKSPTFALIEPYNVSRINFYHIDFYRFSDPREWADAGFRDLYQPDSILLIEWPEKAAGVLPEPDIHIQLTVQGDSRMAQLDARTARGTKWLDILKTKCPRL